MLTWAACQLGTRIHFLCLMHYSLPHSPSWFAFISSLLEHLPLPFPLFSSSAFSSLLCFPLLPHLLPSLSSSISSSALTHPHSLPLSLDVPHSSSLSFLFAFFRSYFPSLSIPLLPSSSPPPYLRPTLILPRLCSLLPLSFPIPQPPSYPCP